MKAGVSAAMRVYTLLRSSGGRSRTGDVCAAVFTALRPFFVVFCFAGCLLRLTPSFAIVGLAIFLDSVVEEVLLSAD